MRKSIIFALLACMACIGVFAVAASSAAMAKDGTAAIGVDQQALTRTESPTICEADQSSCVSAKRWDQNMSAIQQFESTEESQTVYYCHADRTEIVSGFSPRDAVIVNNSNTQDSNNSAIVDAYIQKNSVLVKRSYSSPRTVMRT